MAISQPLKRNLSSTKRKYANYTQKRACNSIKDVPHSGTEQQPTFLESSKTQLLPITTRGLLLISVILITVGLASVTEAAAPHCLVGCLNSTWFQCKSSCVCISPEKVCDGGVTDCRLQDFSDEENCPEVLYNATCGTSVFKFSCHNYFGKGKISERPGVNPNSVHCVNKFWVCDGSNNCQCENSKPEDQCEKKKDESPEVCTECPPDWFKCHNYKKCIPEALQCNGIDECGDGSDEKDCFCKGVKNLCSSSFKNSPSYLGCGTFETCNSVHPCYPYLASHESRAFCESTSIQYSSTCTESKGYSKCFDEKGLMRCIEKHLMCDGISHCADASDEDPRFCTSTVFNDLSGSERRPRVHSCRGACDHLCSHSSTDPSKQTCTCYQGFHVSSHDTFSCISDVTKPAQLFAAGSKLVSLELPSEYFGEGLSPTDSHKSINTNTEHSNIYLENLDNSSPLSLHVEKSLLFYMEKDGRTVVGYNIDSRKIDVTIRVSTKIGGIAVDWIHDLVFLTHPLEGNVTVFSLDGKKQEILYSGLNQPTCIVAVPEKGSIVVCERPIIGGRIIKLSMDGDRSSLSELISGSDFRWLTLLGRSIQRYSQSSNEIPSFKRFSPTSLAVDYAKNVLYFSDNFFSIVAGLDLESQTSTNSLVDLFLLTTDLQFENQKLFGLELFNNRLYVSEVRSKIVYEMYPLSSRMNDDRPAPIMTGASINLSIPTSHSMDLKVFHPSRQPVKETSNHCPRKNPCKYLCLPTYTSYKCICPKGYRLLFETDCELIIDPFLIFANSEGLFKIDLPLNSSKNSTKPVTTLVSKSSIESEGPRDIAWHPVTNVIYWTDPGTKSIQSINYDGTGRRTLVSNLGEPWGIAVDYITHKVYWTDVENNTISATDLISRRRYEVQILVFTDNWSPDYITLDLDRGYIYWSDSAQPYRIDTARMDGSDRGTFASKKVVTSEPSKVIASLVSDEFLFMKEDGIFSVSTRTRKVDDTGSLKKVCCDAKVDRKATFDYFNRSIITTNHSTIIKCAINTSVFDSSTSSDNVLSLANITQKQQQQICQSFKPQFSTTNLDEKSAILLQTSEIRAVSVFHQSKPRMNKEFCYDASGSEICEHFCFLGPSTGSDEPSWKLKPRCTCSFGYEPNPVNQTRCIPRTDNVLLVTSGNRVEIVFYRPGEKVTQHPQVSALEATADLFLWDYNPIDRTIVYFDPAEKERCLVEANISDGRELRRFLRSQEIESFALDYTHRLVFFVAKGSGHIRVCYIDHCDLPGRVRTLVSANITEPRSLLVDPNLGLLFWYDTRQKPTLVDPESDIEPVDFEETYGSVNQIDMTGEPGSRRILTEFCLTCEVDNESNNEESKPLFQPRLSIDIAEQLINFIDMNDIVNKVRYSSTEVAHSSYVRQQISLGQRYYSPAGLASLDGELFWIETDRNGIGKTDKYDLILSLKGSSSMLKKRDQAVSKIAAYSHSLNVVDQCANVSCSYICVPTFTRNPRCLCPPGVWLSPDNRTCEGEPRQFIITPYRLLLPEVSTFWYVAPELVSSDRGATQFTCQSADFGNDIGGTPIAIDYHYGHKAIFVATNKGIYKFNFNLGTPEPIHVFDRRRIPDAPYMLSLAVDWIADNLYWLTTDGIFVSRLDGQHLAKLKSFGEKNGNGGLAVHPRKSIMFWSHPSRSDGIYKSNLDVEHDYHIWSDAGNPDHMSIDYENNHIYWVVKNLSKLYFSDFDGKNVQTLDSLFRQPVALTVFGNITYCIDMRPSTVSSVPHLALTQCNLNTLFRPNTLQSNYPQLAGVRSDHLNNSDWLLESNVFNTSNVYQQLPEPLNETFYLGSSYPDVTPTCSSVDACQMSIQANSGFTALTFVSPLQQRNNSIDLRLHPCAFHNGNCPYICLATAEGHMCRCPSNLPRSRCEDQYFPPKATKPEDQGFKWPTDPPTAPPQIPDFQEQIQMVLIIVVCAAAIVVLLIVSVIICIRRYFPHGASPVDYTPHPSGHNTLRHLQTVPAAAHFSPGGAILNPRMPIVGTLRASAPYLAMGSGPVGARMPGGATAVVHHNAFNGTVYHSLPRRSHCGLDPNNYVMPTNATRRYSTHSLQRNSRFSLNNPYQQPVPPPHHPHNYIELQSHQFSIPTGPAGHHPANPQAVAMNAGFPLLPPGSMTAATSGTLLWTPSHMHKTLSNKNLNKAAINHFNQQQQNINSQISSNVSHSPSASFSSQGSRNTVASSSQNNPLPTTMAAVIPLQQLPSSGMSAVGLSSTLRRNSAVAGAGLLNSNINPNLAAMITSTPKTRSSVSSAKTIESDPDSTSRMVGGGSGGGGGGGRKASNQSHYSQLSHLANSNQQQPQQTLTPNSNTTNSTFSTNPDDSVQHRSDNTTVS